MLPLVSLGPICSTCVHSQSHLHFACAQFIPNRSSRLTTFPSILNCWSHKPPKMPPWGIVGELFLGYVHSQMNPQTCTKFGANRSSRLTASQDFWICDLLTPPAMPPGVLRGDLYLYAHSQMNPPTWTKVGANRSSRLTASPDFRMCDTFKPPKCPLCLSGQFVWGITISRWICTCVPNLVPFGSAVWHLPLTFEFVTP